MTARTGGSGRKHFIHTLRTALVGPQVIPFLPAFILCGYWFGGEAVLLFAAVLFPGVLAALGLFDTADGSAAQSTDPTTGLPDRTGAEDNIEALVAEGPTRIETTACIAIGIDEVDQLLDRHGRRTCEHLMAIAADRVRAATRGKDYLARIDDFEFALVLSAAGRTDIEILLRIANRLQNVISEPVMLEDGRVYLTASAGFCRAAQATGPTGATLLEAAEHALAEAQTSGTATIREFRPEMTARARTRTGLAAEIATALEAGQVVPWFQPQVQTDTGTVTGAEALARWIHPERGVLAPGVFLPLIEEARLGEALGRSILDQSLCFLRDADAAGLSLPRVSVNVTLEELRNPTFARDVEAALSAHSVAADQLTIEVLETVIASTQNDTVVRNLWGLSEMGCRIELDDFGTGHAAIGNIRRFAVGGIKIDRSFVTNLDTDLEQQNLVAAILTMADRLSLETVAEGVETPAERALLNRMGCDNVQGFGIARPMPGEKMNAWLATNRSDAAAIAMPQTAVAGE